MTARQQKNINIIIPLLAGGYIAYYQFNKTKDYKKAAIFGILVFFVLWAITASATKAIKEAKDTELITDVPPDPQYNAAPMTSAIYQDIYEIFGFRNKDIYKDLAKLTDAQFVSVAKYWNENFYKEDHETLKQAISGETLGWELDITKDTIIRRFENLKIN